MDTITEFKQLVEKEMTIMLATCANNEVTMRVVSPVEYDGGILIFTSSHSKKYLQLKQNTNCCLACKTFFAQAKAEFLGPTMLDKNIAYRQAYEEKFPGAFSENVDFGGRDCDFIIFHLTKLSGWHYDNDHHSPDDVPTIPFEEIIK